MICGLFGTESYIIKKLNLKTYISNYKYKDLNTRFNKFFLNSTYKGSSSNLGRRVGCCCSNLSKRKFCGYVLHKRKLRPN